MRVFKGIKILVVVVIAAFAVGFVVEHLWNWLIPGIFGLRMITYWQAIGLFLLGKILFGGIHPRGGGGVGRRRWKERMEERFAEMSPEEREKFRSGMRGCGWGRRERSTERGTV